MSKPMVVAVMLANGRERMVQRAIASFEAQTYPVGRCGLLIFDTGLRALEQVPDDEEDGNIVYLNLPRYADRSIGALRNLANEDAARGYCGQVIGDADLICHWDSDDWSHPRRIEEQVALLQASGKECVGYRELLFWDTRFKDDGNPYGNQEAWLLSLPDPRAMVGASMMYTVDAWRRHPFCDGPRPGADGKLADYEDNHWLAHNNARTVGVSAFRADGAPRMICGIHGDRQSGSYDPATMQKAKEWRRVPEWDSYCAEAMKL